EGDHDGRREAPEVLTDGQPQALVQVPPPFAHRDPPAAGSLPSCGLPFPSATVGPDVPGAEEPVGPTRMARRDTTLPRLPSVAPICRSGEGGTEEGNRGAAGDTTDVAGLLQLPGGVNLRGWRIRPATWGNPVCDAGRPHLRHAECDTPALLHRVGPAG